MGKQDTNSRTKMFHHPAYQEQSHQLVNVYWSRVIDWLFKLVSPAKLYSYVGHADMSRQLSSGQNSVILLLKKSTMLTVIHFVVPSLFPNIAACLRFQFPSALSAVFKELIMKSFRNILLWMFKKIPFKEELISLQRGREGQTILNDQWKPTCQLLPSGV